MQYFGDIVVLILSVFLSSIAAIFGNVDNEAGPLLYKLCRLCVARRVRLIVTCLCSSDYLLAKMGAQAIDDARHHLDGLAQLVESEEGAFRILARRALC